jgi:dolichol kinase
MGQKDNGGDAAKVAPADPPQDVTEEAGQKEVGALKGRAKGKKGWQKGGKGRRWGGKRIWDPDMFKNLPETLSPEALRQAFNVDEMKKRFSPDNLRSVFALEELRHALAVEDDFKRYHGKRGTNLIRRVFHVVASLAVVYYFFGNTFFGIPKDVLIFFALSVVPLTIEIIRLKFDLSILGIRDHEKSRIASYVWFTHGSLLLILITPQQIAAPVILAASIGDPIIGEIRRFRRSIAFSVGILICVVVFLIFRYPVPFAIFAGVVCFLSEATEFGFRWSLRPDLFYSRHLHRESWLVRFSSFVTKTDDDFTMQFFPGLVLLIIYTLNPGWFPEPLIKPIGLLAGLG